MNMGKRLSLVDISNRLDYIMVSSWQVLTLFKYFSVFKVAIITLSNSLKTSNKIPDILKKLTLFCGIVYKLMITSNDLSKSTTQNSTMGSELHLTYHLGLVQIVHFFLWLLIVNIQYNN